MCDTYSEDQQQSFIQFIDNVQFRAIKRSFPRSVTLLFQPEEKCGCKSSLAGRSLWWRSSIRIHVQRMVQTIQGWWFWSKRQTSIWSTKKIFRRRRKKTAGWESISNAYRTGGIIECVHGSSFQTSQNNGHCSEGWQLGARRSTTLAIIERSFFPNKFKLHE